MQQRTDGDPVNLLKSVISTVFEGYFITIIREPYQHALPDGSFYGQVGHKIPVDIPKGAVFYRRVKNWKNSSDEFQEFAYQRNWGIIEPWDGLAKYYNCLD